MKQVLKKTLRGIGIFILSLLVLLLVVILVLQLPVVQTFAARKAATYLSNKTGGTMYIGRVHINFINRVMLQDVVVVDAKKDTLLNAGYLQVDISVFDLLKNQVNIQKTVLKNTKFRIIQSTVDSTYNFQYIINAFASKDTTHKPPGKPWSIDVGTVQLESVNGLYEAKPTGVRVEGQIGSMMVRGDKLDIVNKIIDVKGLKLENSFVGLTLYSRGDSMVSKVVDTIQKSLATNFFLPDIGWKIKANQITFNNNSFQMDETATKPTPYGLDPLHLHVSGLNFVLESTSYIGEEIKGIVRSFSVLEKSGMMVKQLKAAVVLNPHEMSLTNLGLSTSRSKLEGSAKLTYESFGDLLVLKKGSKVDTKLKGYIGLSDIAWIVPSLTADDIIPKGEAGHADIDWDIKGDISDIESPVMKVEIGKSTALNTRFRIKDLPDIDKATFDIYLTQATVSYDDVQHYIKNLKLPKGLEELGLVNVKGHFQGRVVDLKADSLVVTTNRTTLFRGNARAVGLPNIDTTRFDLAITELNVVPAMAFKVADIEPVEEVTRLGKVSYQGTFKGTIYDMAVKGVFVTDAGIIDEDLDATFQHDYKNASYGGHILATDVNLATILADTSLGMLTFETDIVGEGLSFADLNDTLTAKIKEVTYNRYTYKNLDFTGTVFHKEFNGHANIDDPNVKFDFLGLVGFNDSLPRFKFTAMIDTVSLAKLHILTSTMDFHGKVDADFKGLDLDRFQGNATVSNLLFSNDSLTYYVDSVIADAQLQDAQHKTITLHSPIINAKLEGEYHVAQIYSAVQEFINRYFPVTAELANAPKKDTLKNQAFQLDVTASHPLNLTRMFLPAMNRLDTASVSVKFDNCQNIFDVDLKVPGIGYDSISVDTVALGAYAGSGGLAVNLYIDTADYGSQMDVPYLYVKSLLANKAVDLTVAIGGDTSERLYLAGKLARGSGSEFVFNMKDSLAINAEKWDVKPGNEVTFGNGLLKVKDMIWSKKQSQISIISDPVDKPSPPLKIGFTNFDMEEISDLAEFGEYTLGGVLNGSFTLLDPIGKFAFNADMTIDSLVIDSNAIGNLAAKVVPLESDQAIGVDVALKGTYNDLSAKGKISNDFKTIDVDVDMPKLELKAVEPFTSRSITSSQGSLSAKLKVKGDIATPDIDGTIGTHGLSTLVKMFHARYTIEDNEIAVTGQEVKVNQLKLLDEKSRPAYLNGKITHQHFGNINLDLTFKTDGFRFMNSSSKDNGFYYGTLGLAVNANIYGPLKLPIIDVSAVTLPETKFSIVPLGMDQEVQQENFIIFHNPRIEGRADTLVMAKQEYKVETSGVDLSLNFELTKDAQIEVVIDPLTGDKLVCYGSANLGVRVPPNSTPEVTGTLTIDSGYYSFSYQTFLKRRFELQRGSRIDFVGDPMEARLAVTAIYVANATTYELVANQSSSLSNEELAQTHKREKVNVMLNIGGQISAPELSFDIQLPEDQQNTTTSIAARQLVQIRQDETELNKQVFGLLLFGSFIAESSGSIDLAGTGENTALRSVSSVSGLINNQLSKLAGKVQGLEVDLNVDSYVGKSGSEATGLNSSVVTEAQLAVSKKLFNDRITIRVGGNVGLEAAQSGQSSQGSSALSNLAGDFTIEYKITPNGRYKVKVFQTSSYDALAQNNEYKTGVGFTFGESFRSVKQLKKDRQKNKDAKKAQEEKDKAAKDAPLKQQVEQQKQVEPQK